MNERTHMSRRVIIGRVIAAALVVALLAWSYWWLALGVSIVFLFMFAGYYEIILWGIIFDAIYAAPQQSVYDYRVHVGALISIALLFLGIFLKKRLSFYS